MLDHMTFRTSPTSPRTGVLHHCPCALGCACVLRQLAPNMLGFACRRRPGRRQEGGCVVHRRPSPYGGPPATTGCHLAWRANHATQVDAFYRAAMEAGGKGQRSPGPAARLLRALLRRLCHRPRRQQRGSRVPPAGVSNTAAHAPYLGAAPAWCTRGTGFARPVASSPASP